MCLLGSQVAACCTSICPRSLAPPPRRSEFHSPFCPPPGLQGGLLDSEAASRCTTVYLVDRRLDMLPALLSEDLCSLRGGQGGLLLGLSKALCRQHIVTASIGCAGLPGCASCRRLTSPAFPTISLSAPKSGLHVCPYALQTATL